MTKEQEAARKAAEFLAERWGLRFSLSEAFASAGVVHRPEPGQTAMIAGLDNLSSRLDKLEQAAQQESLKREDDK
jgi:hypothetical protein